jgi:ubiquinone/menaquinone biosynthesis C-methylase UbiE
VSDAQTQTFFHGYARDFNAIYGNRNGPLTSLVNRTLRKSMRLRYQRTLEGCEPVEGRTVLDVGCGPGHYGIALAARGARQVTGLDFAEGMIDLARQQAAAAGAANRCEFMAGDFGRFRPASRFDYVVVMGFMDYMAEPEAVIAKALEVTGSRAFFSFPVAGGVLAWQRQLRYRRRCPLFLYTRQQVSDLFAGRSGFSVAIESLGRDFFVTAERS